MSLLKEKLSRGLNLDDAKQFGEAYVEYLSCVELITKTLQTVPYESTLQDAETTKMFRFAKNCLERAEKIHLSKNSTPVSPSASVYELENQKIQQIISSGEGKNVFLNILI
jgi:hypothetical protein